ncbi:hypothetical protein N7488_007415 [Penicillium malachiteum]|nr:hypothetical protein N7488_007415 [Penicillium malachiteum]
MRDEHEGQFEEADLEELVEACFESNITSVTFPECPFCPEDTNMDTISKDWTQHMTQHLLSFSRLSFDGYLEEEDQQSDVSKSIGLSDVSGPQILSGTIADGLREISLDANKNSDSHSEDELPPGEARKDFRMLLGISDQHKASRDLMEENEGLHMYISSSVSELSTTSEIPEIQKTPPTERRNGLRELLSDADKNEDHPMIIPMASLTPPDTELESWEFYISRQSFDQYDALKDPVLRSFRKNLGTSEEGRSDEINQSLELSGFPDSDINPPIKGKSNDGENDPLYSALSVSSGLNQPVLLSTRPDEDHKEAPPSVSHFCTTFLERWAPLFVADLPSSTSKGSPRQLMGEMERFDRWAISFGVHRPGPLSLDSRLEILPDIKRQINFHLLKLEEAMRTIVSQSTSKGVSEIFDEPEYPFSWVIKENDHSAQQVIESEYDRLEATIDALFQIYDPDLGLLASHEPFDTEHVKKKYPHASAEITTRLGLANARRRRGLQDRRRQNLILDRGLDQIFESRMDLDQIFRMDDASSHLAETVRPTPGDVANAMGNDLQGCLPPPPILIAPSDSGEETIFECPYCYSMISIKSLKDWVSHISDDLLPYICVYPKCSVPRQMFHSRREWFLHIRSQHFRKESPDFPQNCPLCLSNIVSGNFEEHVGRHLEELALFALPVPEDDEYETESSSSEAKLLHDVLSATHENPDEGQDQVDQTTQFDADFNQPTTRDASTNTPSSRRPLVPGTTYSSNDEDRPDIIYLRHKLRKNPQYIGNLHALLFDAGEIEDGKITIGQLRAAAAVRLRASSPSSFSMLHNGKPLSWDFMSCREAGLEHKSEVLCVVTNEGPSMQSQISNPGITIDRNHPQAPNMFEQDVDKAEDEYVPSSTRGSIPKIPDLSSIPTSLEKVAACKGYFQQELVPICLQLIDDFPPTAMAKSHFDNRLMHVFDTHLKLLEMLNEIDHGSDIQSIAAYQTLRSQVERASEQLIGARDN